MEYAITLDGRYVGGITPTGVFGPTTLDANKAITFPTATLALRAIISRDREMRHVETGAVYALVEIKKELHVREL